MLLASARPPEGTSFGRRPDSARATTPLTLVGGIRQDLLVASQAGVEHHLAHCAAGRQQAM